MLSKNTAYPRIQKSHRVRRVPLSTSFRNTASGEYTIIKDGIKRKINAEVESIPTGFSVTLHERNSKEIANFEVEMIAGINQSFHRIVMPNYRGYNLGKLLFRLAEQEAKNRGAKKLEVITKRQDALTTALAVGYTIPPEEIHKLKTILGIAQTNPLPPRKELISNLKNKNYPNFLTIRVERKFDLN
ncbi:MAG: GNAT family N-acetyltransferase [archaeon]